MGHKGEKQNARTGIAQQIIVQIGRNVVLVLIVIAVVAITLTQSMIKEAKTTELTLESQSTAYQLADFFDGFEKITAQMAVNPEIRKLLENTGAGDSIIQTEGYSTVFSNLYNIAGTDQENILATWIGDVDASVLTQSDGFTSGAGWDITSRPWFACTKTGSTILTEPYVDASTGQLILSIASPVYDTSGKILGVAGMDISMTQIMTVMQQQKIGNDGYIMLISADGLIIYHPQESLIQTNIADMNISQNVIAATTNGEEGFFQFKELGTLKYGYVSQIGTTGYMVISSLPSSEFYAKIISKF